MKAINQTSDQHFTQEKSCSPRKKIMKYGLKGCAADNLFYTTCPSSGLDIVINGISHEDQFGRHYTH